MNIRKYLQTAKVNMVESLEHRWNTLFWFLCGIAPVIVNYFTWEAVYGDRSEINGFMREDMFSYFLTITILWYFIGGSWNVWLGEIIKNGQLNMYLSKPMHPIIYFIFREQGWKVASLIIIMPIILLASLFLGYSLPIYSLQQLSLLILSIIFAAVIFALWDMTIGMTAFFIQDMIPINRLNRIMFMLFSGQAFPLVLFPAWIAKFNDLLLYRYTFAFSSEIIFTPDAVNYLKMFSIQFIWIVIVILLFNLIYKLGIKKYEAVGA